MNKKIMWLPLIVIMQGCISEKNKDTVDAQKEKDHSKISIGFAGDVMLGRMVNEKISAMQNYTYVWGDMLDALHSTDMNLVNLETTLTKSKQKVPKVFNFKADPDKVEVLKQGSIDVVTLANNHSLDFGVDGLQETIQVLDSAGIKHVGAGNNAQEAREPVIMNIHDVRIGILGYTDNEPGWLATKNQPGINYIEIPQDNDQVLKDIQNLRDKVDLIIVTLHWGPNKRERPSQEFVDFAHQMVNAGADIIQGHSAHLFQGVEVFNKKLIMYDTGDFVDDYMVYPDQRNDRSFFYIVELEGKKLKKLRLIPVLIDNMQVNRAIGSDFNDSIDRLSLLSSEFRSMVQKEGDGAMIFID